ncbi:MAG: hypothetical protein EOO48_12635 [Flavobacterium sp.]|nr:MAG: hypothetical protein EOO48_12635 [Flavobacterium sp.]
MKFKYEILKVFHDPHEVCVFYNINTGGKKTFTCGWYQLLHGKIDSIKVLFDPRPLLHPEDKR